MIRRATHGAISTGTVTCYKYNQGKEKKAKYVLQAEGILQHEGDGPQKRSLKNEKKMRKKPRLILTPSITEKTPSFNVSKMRQKHREDWIGYHHRQGETGYANDCIPIA